MDRPDVSIPIVFVVVVLVTFACGLACFQTLGLEDVFAVEVDEAPEEFVPQATKTRAIVPVPKPIVESTSASALSLIRAAENHLLPFKPQTEAEAASHAVGIAHLAGLHARLYRPRRAQSLFDASVQLAKRIPTTPTREECLQEIASTFAQHGQAEWAWLAAFALKDSEQIGVCMERIGRVYLEQQHIEQAAQAARLMEARVPQARLWLAICETQLQRGQISAAEEALTEAMTSANQLDSVEQLKAADLLPDLGVAQAKLGTWEVALRLAEPAENPARRAEVLEAVVLQQTHSEQPDADVAKLHDLWLQEVRQISTPLVQAKWLARVAAAGLDTHSTEQVELLLAEAQSLLVGAKDPKQEFEALVQISRAQPEAKRAETIRRELAGRFESASPELKVAFLDILANQDRALLADYSQLLADQLLKQSTASDAMLWQKLSQYLPPTTEREAAWTASIAALDSVSQQAKFTLSLGSWSSTQPPEALHPLAIGYQRIGAAESAMPTRQRDHSDTLLARVEKWSRQN